MPLAAHRGRPIRNCQVRFADVPVFPSLARLFGGDAAGRKPVRGLPKPRTFLALSARWASAPCCSPPNWQRVAALGLLSPQGLALGWAVPVQSARAAPPIRPKQLRRELGLRLRQGTDPINGRTARPWWDPPGGAWGGVLTEPGGGPPTVFFRRICSAPKAAHACPNVECARDEPVRSAAWPPRCKAYPTWVLGWRNERRVLMIGGTQGLEVASTAFNALTGSSSS